MISLVRVDDRLLHGQIICAWVPYLKADTLIVASDVAAADGIVREIMCSCAYKGLSVIVKNLEDVVSGIGTGVSWGERCILIVEGLRDALRVYEEGMKFKALNIGNIHHDTEGRKIAPSVILSREDEDIIEKFINRGVKMDIRDVPSSAPVEFVSRKKEHVG